MNKHCLLVIVLLTLFSFSIQAQEETPLSKKKNSIFFETGIPFRFKGESNYWYSPNGYFSIVPLLDIKYTHESNLNFQVSIGYKYISLSYSKPRFIYNCDWRANNVFIGVGYNLHTIDKLSFIPSIYVGLSNVNYNVTKSNDLYYQIIEINSIKIEDANPFYINAELAMDYEVTNNLHLRLSIGYDRYCVNNMNNTERESLITFQTLEAKLGLGYSF